MELQVTDMPFKLSDRTIVILKDLPVFQCENCVESVIEDPVMEKVDALLGKVNRTVELEIVQFAAEGSKNELCSLQEWTRFHFGEHGHASKRGNDHDRQGSSCERLPDMWGKISRRNCAEEG